MRSVDRQQSQAGVSGPGAWAYLGLKKLSENSGPLSSSDRGGTSSPMLGRPIIYVRATEEALEDIADSLVALSVLFPKIILSPPAIFGSDERERWASLERLRAGARVVLATPEGLQAGAPLLKSFSDRHLSLRMGDSRDLSAFLATLSDWGYQRADFVEGAGEFASRGAVVDFFQLEPLRAVRLLFNESKIDSIRTFDPETQASGGFLDEVIVSPVRWEEPQGRIADWLSNAGLWIAEENLVVPETTAPSIRIGSGPELSDFGARPVPRFQGSMDLAVDQMRAWLREGYKVVLFSLNRGEDERVQELLDGRIEGCQFLIGSLRAGFIHSPDKFAILTSSELFDRSYRPTPRWLRYRPQAGRGKSRSDLKPGDYVIHQEYGIARYRGIRPMETPEGGRLDCLQLEYRSSDKLYVPMADFRLVQKYVAAESHRPRLSSLDTRNWDLIKEKVQKGVRELAEKLLRMEAERAARPGFAFPQDSHMETEFAQAFPYEETPDQTRAIEEVKADMMALRPMDRLVVGDVGFGKTEVAMRAAMKCASGLKQAAVLVPTTILADQHYRTFSRRFAEYPVRIAMLSRFQPPKEVRKVLEGLKKGTLDIVIGTQRLLSADIAFKDLGLLVIDEEHRFGVKDKERIKALKADVDVVSLSATPIPRTLYQGLSGLKRVSLIQSAPTGRQPIVTWVGPWSPERTQAAIREELSRGGQAYYVHNRVRTLPQKVRELQQLLPELRFLMAHGRMRGAELERVMWDFFQRKADVLVASSIIESGLDIPTVNTLLVEDAQDFGLAQLYQLRGRIGRERQRAYCYLFYPLRRDLELLPEEARQRLQAMKEFSELGSGTRLAMRDLEIRGAGDLLGAKQHGFINAVGVEYYSELLQEEVGRIAGRKEAPKPPVVQLDLGIEAFLPEGYLPGEMERIAFYKRMLAAKADDLPSLRRELEDLSGPLPESAANLFRLLELRLLAAKAGVREAAQRGEYMEIRFRADATVPDKILTRWHQEYAGRLEFVRDAEGDGVRLRVDAADPLRWLGSFLGNWADK